MDAELTTGQEPRFPVALLARCGADLYRANAFRVTGLGVEAGGREIARQAERLQTMQKLGSAIRPGGALALEPPPDTDALRQASQRLADPEQRLVDELFWFWPLTAGCADRDPALAALARGDLAEAARQWTTRELNDDASAHNLAVLAHLQALDLERLGDELPRETAQQQSKFWLDAQQQWRKVLQNEAFWGRLTARVRILDDPRLTTGLVRRIRQALPEMLLTINAQLAVAALERQETDRAYRHLTLIRASGFDQADIDAALARVIQPFRKRLMTLIDTARNEAQAAPSSADVVAERLLLQSKGLTSILCAILPTESTVRVTLLDELASCADRCLTVFVNETRKWSRCLELEKQIHAIAASPGLRSTIEEEIEVCERNAAEEEHYGVCWFCKKQAPTPSCEVEVKLYGDVKSTRQWGDNMVRTTWNIRTMMAPRCNGCRQLHERFAGVLKKTFVVVLFLGYLSGVALFLQRGEPWGIALVAGVVVLPVALISLGIVIPVFFGIEILVLKMKYGTKPTTKANQFPPIAALMKAGWKLGDKPPGNS
ncbi:hypothetical protein [Candidatus Accumulibacter vicinus]|uniref:Uncharacterized protein n=1 Tax=Candidatus Accumulibacter vicinus TaxID=2954382 RepID=A0A084Y4S2_9PROT|nr:hypothetical protein [Candidatus Accumulibacter vicinus]KFB69716.1 MAG: hypothetical protein CAPSK01_000550 [Candidatus Accumulibacter vicinus]